MELPGGHVTAAETEKRSAHEPGEGRGLGRWGERLDPRAGDLEVGSPLKAPGPARPAWQQPSEGEGEGRQAEAGPLGLS